MSDKPNLFEELITRRIPHIIGMYVAAVWLSVEIADWVSERFGVFDQFSSYVFVGMLSFIPLVIMLAWGHGRPGKDKWSKYELVWLPLNVVLSVLAVNHFIKSPDVSIQQNANIEPVAIMSATLDPIVTNNITSQPEVKSTSHNNVLTFFWENKTNNEDLNWLSYGSAWLFSQDIKRTPEITAITPYDSQLLINELVNKGFPKVLNIPFALAIQAATKQSKEWVVLGSFAYDEVKKSSIKFEAKLYNVKTGAVEISESLVSENNLSSLDTISKKFGDFLHESNNYTNIIPDYAIADHASNNMDAIKTLIEAKNAVAFENDYLKGIELIEQAIDQDKTFAEAMLLASKYYRAKGDFENATKYSKQALNFDYKIYKESVYQLKASLFDMSGQQNKALLVLENWAEMFPTSPLAQVTLANKYLIGDNTLDKAEKQFEKLLNIENSNPDTLINLGQIYRVQGDQDKSLEVLKQFLESNPGKVEAYMELANAYKQFGMFDEALEMYQQASIIGSENYAAEIGIASTVATQGDYEKGISLLDELIQSNNTDHQHLLILNEKVSIYMQTGQISKSIEALELMKKPAKKILPPLNYIFSMDGSTVQLLILQGKYDEALEYTKTIRENTKPPFNNIAMQFNIMTYFSMEDKEKFKSELLAFEEFLKTFPIPSAKSFLTAWNAQVTYWDGDVEKSLQQLDMAIEESKQSIVHLQRNNVVDQFIYGKAEILFELGNTKDAMKEIEFLLTRNPLFAYAHYLSAKIYQSQNNTQKSEVSIQKAKDIWKDADKDFVGLLLLQDI